MHANQRRRNQELVLSFFFFCCFPALSAYLVCVLILFFFFSLHVDMPMERKTPVAYPDGVYEIAGGDRGNVILIANISQHGLTGFGSTRRSALFTFFGNSGNRYSSLY